MIPETSYIIRPRYTWLIYIFGSMILLMLIAALCSYLYENTPFENIERPLFVAAFVTAVMVPIIWLVSRMQIILYSDAFIYSNGFKKQLIVYNEIIKSNIQLALKNKYPDTFWNFETTNIPFTSIRISLYSRKDLQAFAAKLLTESPMALHSPLIHEMAEGKFPWYIK